MISDRADAITDPQSDAGHCIANDEMKLSGPL